MDSARISESYDKNFRLLGIPLIKERPEFPRPRIVQLRSEPGIVTTNSALLREEYQEMSNRKLGLTIFENSITHELRAWNLHGNSCV